MSFGKMNTFIDLVEKQKVLDDEGFSTITDVVVASVELTEKVDMAVRNGLIAAPLPTPQIYFDFV